MRDYISLGPVPCEEDCTQVGRDNYDTQARAECKRFAAQILRHYPEPNAAARIGVKSFPHDFGSYYEVVAYYDTDDEVSTRWAFDIESDTKDVLHAWDDHFMGAV